jgi:hypothetical protein
MLRSVGYFRRSRVCTWLDPPWDRTHRALLTVRTFLAAIRPEEPVTNCRTAAKWERTAALRSQVSGPARI